MTNQYLRNQLIVTPVSHVFTTLTVQDEYEGQDIVKVVPNSVNGSIVEHLVSSGHLA